MRIGVLGAGAWGSALAHVARAAGHEVQVWSRGMALEPLQEAQGLILAVPAQGVRAVLSGLKSIVTNVNKSLLPLIISAKGIEQGTGLFMNEVVAEVLPAAEPMVLSGPSFAADVMKGLPTAVVMAAQDIADARHWAETLSLPHFRIYASDDVKGVEIGGALKNVLAIACGISDGRGLGDSARAALTTRGFAELTRFAAKFGAKPETLMGLSGLGDLLLTCSSRQSRNYSFGHALGEGKTVEQALAQSRGVVEGAATVRIAQALARRHGVDMPIVDAVHAIVDEGRAPDQEIARLLSRPLGPEIRQG
ncbi:MAG: NAD(P)H-dependent glycerol-3-phosphate dehydrogenase [Aestuariivirga sp.]|uniref:NAD(P)H-dependent glycerol-3-phosphate dehydrogenase n=1 Tax=Aestuariivirga sp. TaxID=2650926 RepID=UPI0030166ACE